MKSIVFVSQWHFYENCFGTLWICIWPNANYILRLIERGCGIWRNQNSWGTFYKNIKNTRGILDKVKEYLYQEKWLKGTLGKSGNSISAWEKCKYISTYSILLTDRDIKKCQKDPLWQMFITAIPTFAYCTITVIEVSCMIHNTHSCNEDLFVFFNIYSIMRLFLPS